jgi:uncharacterized protein (TIGR03546 family)
MIKGIARLIVALNANTRPGEIAAGAAFGLLLALVPGGNLLWSVLFIPTFFLKINMAMELLLLGLLRLAAPLADPGLDAVGYAVLSLAGLRGFFIAVQGLPLAPWTRFNDTVVMGGFLAGLLLWAPVFLLVRLLVTLYRRRLREKIAESKLAKAVSHIPLLSAIGKAVQALGGASTLTG